MRRDIQIVPHQPSIDAIDYVCRRMRPLDRQEIFAERFNDSIDQLINELVELRPQALEFYSIGSSLRPRPIALMALWPRHAHVAEVMFFGTREISMIMFPLTAWIRDTLIPRARACGVHRVEARAMQSWRANCRWLERLGARRECDLEMYGKAGETFVQFAWTAPMTEKEK